jgi:integrase
LKAMKLDLALTALVLCALDTLQRLSSVADLKRAQDHGSYLTFLNTKTKGGKVPVSRRLRAALDAHLATLEPKGAYLFPALQVGSVGARRNLVIRHFSDACDAAGVVGFTFHGLRHTGASRMLAARVDIETVRRIGGWANYDVLRRYLHPDDEATTAAVETIGPPQPAHTRSRRGRQRQHSQSVRSA